jgi:epsilon-lactone hydrolase
LAVRRWLARALVRAVVRPGLEPRLPLAERRRRAERTARLLPLPRGIRRSPAGDENPGGEWLLPRHRTPDDTGGALLYLHGGGFVLGSPISHRAVAARLAHITGLAVLLAHYRLAPEHRFPAGLEDARHAWRELCRNGARPAALAGDSAGGWLALALVLAETAAGGPRPKGLALFSPLVDLAGAEAIPPEADDLLLPPEFVVEGARAWRGDLPVGDPRLELLGAPLDGLPPVFIAFDRDEALAADARRLAAAARAAGVVVEVEEAQELWHAWPLFAGLLPEADATLRRAAAVLVPAGGEA